MALSSRIDRKALSLCVFFNIMMFLSLLSGSHVGLSFIYNFLIQMIISIVILTCYRNKISISLMKGIYPALIMFIVLVVIISFSLSVMEKSERSIFSEMRIAIIFMNFVFAFLLYYFLCATRNVVFLFLSMPIGIAFIAIYYLFDYYCNVNTLIVEDVKNLPFVFNRRLLDMYCIFSIIYISYLYLLKIRINRWMIGVLYIINVAFVFWVGGRGAILSISFAILFLIVSSNKKKITHAYEVFSFSILTIFGLMMAIPFSIFNWNGLYRFKKLFISSEKQDLNSISSGRVEIWLDALPKIRESLWFGHGPDSYREIGNLGFFQPHNFILQYLIEFGVIGTTLILLLIFIALLGGFVFVYKVNSNRDVSETILFSSIIIGYCTQGLIDGVFYWSATTMFVTIGVVGVIFSVKKLNAKQLSGV